MKILNVGVFEEINLASTNIQQVNALERMGHAVIKYPYRYNLQKFGPMLGVNLLLEKAAKELPDIIWFNKCSQLPPRATKELTDKYLTVHWHMDSPRQASEEVRQHMVNCDYAVCSSKAAAKDLKQALGIPMYVVRDGVDFSIHKPYMGTKNHRFDCGVSFIGSPDAHRLDMIKTILEVTNRLHIYGFGWEGTPYASYFKGPAENEGFSKVVAHSLINIGTQRDTDRSIRTFWILGCKGFLLNESFMEIEEDFKDEKHLVIWKNLDELKKLLFSWLSNTMVSHRNIIAEAGYNHVIKNFTWEKTFEHVFNLISGEKEREEYEV